MYGHSIGYSFSCGSTIVFLHDEWSVYLVSSLHMLSYNVASSLGGKSFAGSRPPPPPNHVLFARLDSVSIEMRTPKPAMLLEIIITFKTNPAHHLDGSSSRLECSTCPANFQRSLAHNAVDHRRLICISLSG